MREVKINVYAFSELSEKAQERAVEVLQEKLDGLWWDSSDNDDVRDVMIFSFAEKVQAPGWDTYGPADFPGVTGVTVEGWDLERGLGLQGALDRKNAPALPWVEGVDLVTLTPGRGSDATAVTIVVIEKLDCDDHAAGVSDDQRSALAQFVSDAVSDAFADGKREYEYKTGAEYARECAKDHEFTEDGDLY